MKYIFYIVFFLLVISSVLTILALPEQQTEIPVLYWVTDLNPARHEQVKKFHDWLESTYGDELQAKYGFRKYELKIDTANMDPTKIIIQGVSGAGGDIIDIMQGGGSDIHFLQSIGILDDITDDAVKMGFSPEQTYDTIRNDIVIDDRQYAFPCNVVCSMLWVNKKTFEKYNLPIPPRRWDFETFERVGKEFVKAANPPGKRQEIFFLNNESAFENLQEMRRSLGLCRFNETLTKCILNDPRNVKVLNLLKKWTYEDHLYPSAADSESLCAMPGSFNFSLPQLFQSGNYAMVRMGRYGLIPFRQIDSFSLSVSEIPHGGFPNNIIFARTAGIYKGSNAMHKELARYFLTYLASEDYNIHIIKDADALPPNPKYTQLEEFEKPKDYPNEWGCHEVFAETVQNIGIGCSYSPFILPETVARIDKEFYEGFMSGLYSAEEASDKAANKINEEIARTLKENTNLMSLYKELQAEQNIIETLRADDKKVPAKYIKNQFYLKYYNAKGWLEEQ
jgi:ABC-type glycerol-3-phosphate transport system substrate-binding protein